VNQDKGLIDKRDAGNDERYFIGIANAEVLNCRVTTADGQTRIDSGAVTGGVWTYLVCRYDGSLGTEQLEGFIDGGSVATASLSGSATDLASAATDDVVLGKRYNNRWYEGDIDELRVSSVARDDSYIAAQALSVHDAFVTFHRLERK
jgi:hypothetical protein